MKKRILSLLFALLLIPSIACANFFSDIIVTSPDGIWTDARAYATLADAITAVGADERHIVIASEQACGLLTVPANVTLMFIRDGAINNTNVLTINTTSIIAEDRQIFTGGAGVDFADGSVLRSSWFADTETAISIVGNDNVTLVISAPDTIGANVIVGTDVTLKWESQDNIITMSGGFTLSAIGNVIADTFQLFAGAGDFDFLEGSLVSSSWFTNLRLAITTTSDENVDLTILVDQPESIDANVTLDADQALMVLSGCIITLDPGDTLTANGPLLIGEYQAFDGTGTLAGAQTLTYIPDDWFAGTETVTITTALVAADQTQVLTGLGITATNTEINTVADGVAAKNSHTHLLATGATDVTATAAQINNKANSEAFVTNASGSPNVSDTFLDVEGDVVAGAWESVGPTASGMDNIWTGLDTVPASVDWIEVKITASGTDGAASSSLYINTYVRDNGSVEIAGNDTLVSYVRDESDGSGNAACGGVNTVKIPVSSRSFDVYYASTLTIDSVLFYLVGYGYNP